MLKILITISALLAFAWHTPASAADTPLTTTGVFSQGGYVIGKTTPNTSVKYNAKSTVSDANGNFIIGLDRDAPSVIVIKANGQTKMINIDRVKYNVQRINGLPKSQVTPRSPKTLARIKRESKLKAAGYRSNAAINGFTQTFIAPVEGRITGKFGNQRVLNGVPKRPHFGVDIAAPKGTAIVAPADAIVTLANADMHFEGGLVFLDHGQGLVTVYLHMNDVKVTQGQKIKQGDIIGTVGAKGRATGPHLCWRMRWRGQNMDPMLWVKHTD